MPTHNGTIRNLEDGQSNPSSEHRTYNGCITCTDAAPWEGIIFHFYNQTIPGDPQVNDPVSFDTEVEDPENEFKEHFTCSSETGAPEEYGYRAFSVTPDEKLLRY